MIYVNGKAVGVTKFPGGEVNVRVDNPPVVQGSRVIVTAYLTTPKMVMALLLTVDALERAGTDPSSQIELLIPYLPYARQDRVCNAGEALSVAVMARMINSLNCRSVTIYDPHSDVGAALIDRCRVVHQWDFVTPGKFRGYDYVVSPDAGAEKKAFQVARGMNLPVIAATKHRDVKTGDITGVALTQKYKMNGGNALIVDDICDGGRTFIELAKVLKKTIKPDSITLYVTHGIFSKGFDVFEGKIDTVIFTNSLNQTPELGPAALIKRYIRNENLAP